MKSPTVYRSKIPFIPLLNERPNVMPKSPQLVGSTRFIANSLSQQQLKSFTPHPYQTTDTEFYTQKDTISRDALRVKRCKTDTSDQMENQYHYVMEDRINILEQLTFIVRNENQGFDLLKLIEGINEISRTLTQVSKTEIEFKRKSRDLEQKNLDIVMMQKQLEKAQIQIVFQRTEIADNQKKFALNQLDQSKSMREIHNNKILIDELSRKIICLEKRIEMTLERNLNIHQDKLRNTLNDLIKETEEQKRQLRTKNKEIDRLKDVNLKITNKNLRLQKKLDSHKTKSVGKEDPEESNTQVSKVYDYAFDPSTIPNSLEFRHQSLPTEYSYLLLDLVEHGPDNFAYQILNLDNQIQKKDLMSLIASIYNIYRGQFISYREFSERYNSLMCELNMMLNYSHIQDYQVHVAKGMGQVLNADIVHLWIIDKMTGIIHTYDQNHKEIRAILNDGAFLDVISQGIIINKIKDNDILLYANENGDVYGDRLLLIPLMGASRKSCGVLEIRGISPQLSDQMDVQYFGLILSKFSKVIFQKIIDIEILNHELKYKDMFHTQFMCLCNSKNELEFSEGVQETIYKIFQVCQSSVMFVRHDKFIKYDADGKEKSHNITSGIAGLLYKLGRPQIITDVKKNYNFDDTVDIASLLPVYSAPFKDNQGKIAMIVQFVLKQKLNESRTNMPNVGFKMDSIDQDAHKFCLLVQTAYLLFRK